MTNTLAYYDTATNADVKSVIVYLPVACIIYGKRFASRVVNYAARGVIYYCKSFIIQKVGSRVTEPSKGGVIYELS